LRSLIDKSLVSTTQDARYEVHELLRQYGEEQLATSGEAYAVHTAHSDYYLDLLAQRQRHLKGHRQLVALDEIESDFRNIRAAWSWAVQERNEAALERALDSLYLFFTFRSRYAEGIEFFDIAHQQLAPRPMDEPSLTCRHVLARLAWLQVLNHRAHADIEANPETSLALAQKAG
jgi:predicted ATPase